MKFPSRDFESRASTNSAIPAEEAGNYPSKRTFLQLNMKLQEFDYFLPTELIAQTPAEKRSSSRLLVMENHGRPSDRLFADFPDLIQPEDLLVFNDTRVIRARLLGRKETGGKIEVLVERILDDNRVLASIRASHAPKTGSRLHFDGAVAELLEKREDMYLVRFEGDAFSAIERCGHLPLPPYISREANGYDEERYQTVYAKNPGAVAAPTAGLHFDEGVLNRIREKGIGIARVTLHVGAGTFKPVRSECIHEHRMHGEIYHVPQETMDAVEKARSRGGKVVSVGTTTLRALESAASSGNLQGETSIFITPGFRFRIVDRLLTNFHLPKSTLLMLVSAFSGMEAVRNAYRHAVDEQYRFFSYGDAMLMERKEN